MNTLHQTQRMTNKGSPITVIEPSRYLQFFEEIRHDEEMPLEFKAFLAVAVSGGCRVTEALKLPISAVSETGAFRVAVLKKRSVSQIYRTCQMCPTALAIVEEYLNGIPVQKSGANELMFPYHRTTIGRWIKKKFGENACTHSITRHSHISWLLHDQNISTARVAIEMAVGSAVVDRYSHANIAVDQAKRFK